MPVITISRGSFSGGKALAERLAGTLGYRCVDRDVIVERAAACGVSQDELRAALQKPPTFLERLRHRKYLYLTVIQAALADEVRSGKAVYHGNAGHLLLGGGPHILRVRIIAPLESRIAMAQERLKLTREEALAYIQRTDQERRKWTQYLYGVDWGDPTLYDVVLNLEHVDIPEACQLLAGLARQRRFDDECQRAMNDLALASRVRAELALAAATSHLEVEVAARGGAIHVRGWIDSPEEIDAVFRVAEVVPGVADLSVNDLTAPGPS